MYFDEDMILDLRLNILNQYVKKFVITESVYTHNGKKRDLKFDINNFNSHFSQQKKEIDNDLMKNELNDFLTKLNTK